MVVINDDKLKDYLMYKLDKITDRFSEEELSTIDEIVVDFEDLDLLKYFINIKSITFKDIMIEDSFLENFSMLTSLKFVNCMIDSNCIKNINLKELNLTNCNIDSYDFIYEMNLSSLTIIGGIIDIEKLNVLKDLVYLQISYCDVLNINFIELPLLRELYINNTNLNNLDLIKHLNLEKLGIDEEQYNNNYNYMNELISNNVNVLNNGFIPFKGGN